MTNSLYLYTKHYYITIYGKILAENVKLLCKQQGKQLKDLASDMYIDA